ncbi:NYN domain-containing protein [Candidatus Collierbacteria bacterium]|nr:NYN domain-containing protein [Candidatus Collierbacteria bacterium]
MPKQSLSKKHLKLRQVIYAFIDSQNLNLGTGKDIYKGKKLIYKGWKLDFKKFRQYLSDKFRAAKAVLFIGYIKQNEKLYRQLKSYGYDLVYKPTVKDNHGKAKGNVDAELVLHAAAIEYCITTKPLLCQETEISIVYMSI